MEPHSESSLVQSLKIFQVLSATVPVCSLTQIESFKCLLTMHEHQSPQDALYWYIVHTVYS